MAHLAKMEAMERKVDLVCQVLQDLLDFQDQEGSLVSMEVLDLQVQKE